MVYSVMYMYMNEDIRYNEHEMVFFFFGEGRSSEDKYRG